MPRELDQQAALALLQSIGVKHCEVRKLADAGFGRTKSQKENSVPISWHSRESYLSSLSQYNVFMAPRRHEGLGMTFLEAMAMGMCVVAEDLPTVNEYIQPGYNGILYRGDRETLYSLHLFEKNRLADLGRNARRRISEIHQKWVSESQGIRASVEELIKQPWSPQTPSPMLLEATLDFKRNPKKLWQLSEPSFRERRIWRSHELESKTMSRQGFFGKAKWLLQNPRACILDWLTNR